MQCATIYFLHVSELLSRLHLKRGFAVICDKVIPLSAVISFFLLCTVSGCSRKAAPPPEVVRPVKTIVLSPGGELQTRTFSGRAQASREAELAFQVPGLLISLPVREGQSWQPSEAFVLAQ